MHGQDTFWKLLVNQEGFFLWYGKLSIHTVPKQVKLPGAADFVLYGQTDESLEEHEGFSFFF